MVGSGNFVVTRVLTDSGAGFVAARHETAAVTMADAWARVTGEVGVATVHQGPGFTNALTGLAEAAKSRTPLVVLAGDTSAAAVRSNFRWTRRRWPPRSAPCPIGSTRRPPPWPT